MPFNFRPLEIPDVVLIESKRFVDHRGYFSEFYKQSELAGFGIKAEFVQDSVSFSTKGVLRGLHFQKPPKAQAKLVRAIFGRIWDVAVDLRQNSPTFGKWVARELTDENGLMLYIPSGFAHGFLVLSEKAFVVYKMSNEYAPDLEGGVIWNDPDLNISWPMKDPIISEKDARLPKFQESFKF